MFIFPEAQYFFSTCFSLHLRFYCDKTQAKYTQMCTCACVRAGKLVTNGKIKKGRFGSENVAQNFSRFLPESHQEFPPLLTSPRGKQGVAALCWMIEELQDSFYSFYLILF